VHRVGRVLTFPAACANSAQVGTDSGVRVLGVELLRVRDELRQARDSETAHLEAILKDEGPKALRLARLRDILRERGNSESLDLQSMAGLEPRLWLDLGTCVVMRPDAGTYQLSVHGRDSIETILQTANLDEVVAECSRHLAHRQVAASRQPTNTDLALAQASPTTLIYIWMTGVFTGVAIFAICAIFLKKMPF
jgi:hypothetical protein